MMSSTRSAARILVVDDNVDLAQGLARMLRILGYQVQVAHDGPSGLDLARQLNPEFIVLDIGLPGMDGYQIAAHIRAEEAMKGAVIIAISGYGHDEDRRRSREAGIDHHLVKPIAAKTLIDLIHPQGPTR
jgi:CheY-like chemotaxis protein